MEKREFHIEVARSARCVTLGGVHPGLRQVWIVCHGYGQLVTQFIDYFRVLDDGTRLIVAPEGLSRFYLDHSAGVVGASWMTKEDRGVEIADYVGYLDAVSDHVLAEVGRESVALHLLGFSQGAATVSRWVERGKVQPDRVVLWAGAMPPDVDLAALRRRMGGAGLDFVVGETDEYASSEVLEQQEARLREHGFDYSVIRFAGGHRLDKEVLRVLG
ncbi:MAG: phospholipase [Gemmatimonadota bacterium]|nr:MAG: phospholipase [Gemmatimonadota bacterium]